MYLNFLIKQNHVKVKVKQYRAEKEKQPNKLCQSADTLAKSLRVKHKNHSILTDKRPWKHTLVFNL